MNFLDDKNLELYGTFTTRTWNHLIASLQLAQYAKTPDKQDIYWEIYCLLKHSQ